MAEAETLAWNDALLSGVDEMDHQHRILVDMLVEVSAKLTHVENETLFDRITQDLLAYAIYHFDTEEKLMRQYGYAAAAPDEEHAHLTAHRAFAERVVTLRADARAGHPGGNEALLAFLKGWLVNHILTTDKRLGQFVCAARAAGGR